MATQGLASAGYQPLQAPYFSTNLRMAEDLGDSPSIVELGSFSFGNAHSRPSSKAYPSPLGKNTIFSSGYCLPVMLIQEFHIIPREPNQ